VKKMKKSIKTQLLVLAFVGICLFSFIPAGLCWGKKNKRITYRPITDWTDVNPFAIGPEWYVGYVGGDRQGNNYWMWIDSLMSHFWLFNWDTFEPLIEYIYEFDGYIKEKLRPDGSLDFTIKLMVKDLYLEIMDALYDENGDPIWTMDYFGDNGQFIASGYVDYYFELKFTLAPEYEGFTGTIIPQALWPMDFDIPGGTREQGCELPTTWAFLFFPEELGIQVKSLKFMAFGSGVVYEPGWFYPEPGELWPDPPFPIECGTTDIFFYFNAKFKSGEIIDWPHGHSGFKVNYITLYNIEYY
jgi:hypothetical protein